MIKQIGTLRFAQRDTMTGLLLRYCPKRIAIAHSRIHFHGVLDTYAIRQRMNRLATIIPMPRMSSGSVSRSFGSAVLGRSA